MNITIVTPPPFEPVTVVEAYQHLRWDPEIVGSPPEEVFPLEETIKRNIASARTWVETQTRRALVDQTVRLSDAGFPTPDCMWSWFGWAPWPGRRDAYIELLRPPLLEVLAVEYYDGFGNLRTVDPADYFTTDDLVPRLMFKDYRTPTDFARRSDAARVTYRAGYTPAGSPPSTQEEFAANVPSELKDAILIGVQLLSDRFDANEKADLERTRAALLYGKTVNTF